MKRSLAIVLLLGILLGACGESDEEQAQDAVCDARASIQKQVDELSGLTLGTATAASVGTASPRSVMPSSRSRKLRET